MDSIEVPKPGAPRAPDDVPSRRSPPRKRNRPAPAAAPAPKEPPRDESEPAGGLDILT